MLDNNIVAQKTDADLEIPNLLPAQEPRHFPPHDSPRAVLREAESELDAPNVLTGENQVYNL